MNSKKCMICLAFFWLLGVFGIGPGRAQASEPDLLSNLPVRLYTPVGQKPVLAFSTPCMELSKIDKGVGPLADLRELMAMAVVNTSQLLPIDLQPVCR